MKRVTQLVPFASHDAATRGRLYDEPESRTRGAFQRDRDRIIHCTRSATGSPQPGQRSWSVPSWRAGWKGPTSRAFGSLM